VPTDRAESPFFWRLMGHISHRRATWDHHASRATWRKRFAAKRLTALPTSPARGPRHIGDERSHGDDDIGEIAGRRDPLAYARDCQASCCRLSRASPLWPVRSRSPPPDETFKLSATPVFVQGTHVVGLYPDHALVPASMIPRRSRRCIAPPLLRCGPWQADRTP